MVTAAEKSAPQRRLPAHWSLTDLQRHLGNIPLGRVRLFPSPGYATVQDVTDLSVREGRFYELADGILVEKTAGWYESLLAGLILTRLNVFLEQHDLGLALGPDGMLKILPDTVKIPDVSFIRWERLPDTPLPRRPVPAVVPNLVVEVLSDGNTDAEMDAKLQAYLQAGVELVWYVDPKTRSVRCYAGTADAVLVDRRGVLDGGAVLPGFRLSLRQLFDTAERGRPKD